VSALIWQQNIYKAKKLNKYYSPILGALHLKQFHATAMFFTIRALNFKMRVKKNPFYILHH
jgi:hypothetical protein